MGLLNKLKSTLFQKCTVFSSGQLLNMPHDNCNQNEMKTAGKVQLSVAYYQWSICCSIQRITLFQNISDRLNTAEITTMY